MITYIIMGIIAFILLLSLIITISAFCRAIKNSRREKREAKREAMLAERHRKELILQKTNKQILDEFNNPTPVPEEMHR